MVRNRKPYAKTKLKFFMAKSDVLFFQTYNQGSTLRSYPVELEGLVEETPVGHTSFRVNGNKKGFITTYLVNRPVQQIASRLKIHGKDFEIRSPDKYSKYSDDDEGYNIIMNLLDLGALTEKLIQVQRDDISEFCNYKKAKKKDKIITHINIVPEVKNQPGFTMIKPGKHGLIKDGKGKYENICPLDIGIDLSKGCVSNVSPEGIYQPCGKCSYCYAHQNGPCYLETIYKFTEDEFIKRLYALDKKLGIHPGKTLHLRIGQTAEANSPPGLRNMLGFPNTLVTALRAIKTYSKERKIKVAFPTKIPDFDEQTKKLLREIDISVLGSIGYSELETGINAHGYNYETRCRLIKQLAGEGINASLYVATDITRAIEHKQKDADYAFNYAFKNKLNLQFLDMRVTKKKDAKLITGYEWDELKGSDQLGLFRNKDIPWRLTGQNYLHAHRTHPDFLEIIKDFEQIRLCSTHVIDSEKRCGRCFM